MKVKNCILLVIFCFGATINAFSQTKEVPEEKFWQPIRDAYKPMSEISRRITSQKEYFEDGKLNSTTRITDEYLVPDKRHYLEVKKLTDRTNRKEYFQIGENYYCKENDGEWKQSNKWCEGTGISGLSGVIERKFTVEDVKLNNQSAELFTNFYTFKISDSDESDKGKIAYSQSKFWLDVNGLILRFESKKGLLNLEKIYSQETRAYEYNPKKLKIELPVKGK